MDAIHSRWRPLKGRPKSLKRARHLNRIRPKQRKSNENETVPAGLNDPVDADGADEFLFVHSSSLAKLLQQIKCQECDEKSLKVVISERNGFCVKLSLRCQKCDDVISSCYSSPEVDNKSKQSPYTVNRKVVESTVEIGLGHAAPQKFCSSMSIRPLCSRTFQQHLSVISSEAVVLENKVLEEARLAVRQAHIEKDSSLVNQEVLDIAVSYDGTWHKRGHTSLYGVGLVIDISTGLVLDFEILSKYCYSCVTTAARFSEDSDEYKVWHEEHKNNGECHQNYTGSSGSMEVSAAERLWTRSIEKTKLRYTTVLSDGDARTWTHLNISPYGSDVSIEKEECINHIHKRMGKGLRDLAQKHGLGGKKEGALTANKIELLTKYYRRAIVNNLGDVNSMQEAVNATLLHCSSTDDYPQHQLCPTGQSSWCFFNKSLARDETPPSHQRMQVKLNKKVQQHLKPLYKRLSDVDLLKRCKRGATQNSKESLHALIWRKCAKEIFVSKQKIHLAVINAVSERNLGIYQSHHIKASLRNQTLTRVEENVYKSVDQLRAKRKVSQEDFRHCKRLKRLNKKQEKKPIRSKDYAAGAH